MTQQQAEYYLVQYSNSLTFIYGIHLGLKVPPLLERRPLEAQHRDRSNGLHYSNGRGSSLRPVSFPHKTRCTNESLRNQWPVRRQAWSEATHTLHINDLQYSADHVIKLDGKFVLVEYSDKFLKVYPLYRENNKSLRFSYYSNFRYIAQRHILSNNSGTVSEIRFSFYIESDSSPYPVQITLKKVNGCSGFTILKCHLVGKTPNHWKPS